MSKMSNRCRSCNFIFVCFFFKIVIIFQNICKISLINSCMLPCINSRDYHYFCHKLFFFLLKIQKLGWNEMLTSHTHTHSSHMSEIQTVEYHCLLDFWPASLSLYECAMWTKTMEQHSSCTIFCLVTPWLLSI